MRPFLAPLCLLDTTGFDIGPLVEAQARDSDVPLAGLIALLRSESGFNPYATRDWTTGAIWPDWSYGLVQMTVQTAVQYGIGDGTPESWPTVKVALFDRATSLRVGAEHFVKALSAAAAHWPWLTGDNLLLHGLAYYNAGGYAFTDSYWSEPATAVNVASYSGSLEWAHRLLREQGLEAV